MLLDFREDGVCKLSMPAYIDAILSDCDVKTTADTPAASNLFEVDEEAELLTECDSKSFHTMVAKLLYAAKRVRVDILLPVNFLCSRVLAPNTTDQRKLKRVLRYLKGTRDMCMRICVHDYVFTAYVDASYGVHADAKSHTGMILSLGSGTILAKSTKQKIVTKSSTEAEAVAASDSGSDLLAVQEFLVNQGYPRKPAVLFQDNMSAIQLLNNGKKSSDRTKHMQIRYFWLKERIETGELRVVYLPTESMWADMLTKPLQGELFKKFRALVLNLPA